MSRFDQFTIEQIAGDLLDSPTEDQLIATAFHRNTMTNNEGGTNNEEFRNVAIVDRVNTTMAVWMGTTMACAQCHTHKYDPITQEEYFKFFAFFNQSEDADIKDERPLVELWSDEQQSARMRLETQIAELKRSLEHSSPEIEAAQAKWLANLREEPAWEVIKPSSAEAKGRDLIIHDDGWIRGEGHKAVRDHYTLTFPFQRSTLTGLRLEVSKEQKTNFVLSQLKATWQPKESRANNVHDVRVEFTDAVADYSQKSFSATDVLQGKVDQAKGWAIGGRTAQTHELKLTVAQPIDLGEGELTVELNYASQFRGLLLDHFRLSVCSDPAITDWVKMTEEVRSIIRSQPESWTIDQAAKVARYYREITPLLAPVRQKLSSASKQLAAIKPHTTVPVMRQLDDDKRRPTYVQIRGNYQSHGQAVTEGTPEAFHPLDQGRPRDRLALAEWLVDEQNPLTPRVIANRHWEQLFGTGIVETSEEFGSQGELPSHPELLDWLAVELRESGWDIKHLLKLIVMSATYRQSSVTSAASVAADPQNRMLARGPRFRISAEMVRDQALFVSGLLSETMFGPPVHPPQPELGLKAAFGGATDWKTSEGDDKYRRGLYTTWRRSSPYASMAQFDCAQSRSLHGPPHSNQHATAGARDVE